MNDQAAIVSVIMPVFNMQGMLRETLDAVFGQSLQDIELLAVDDCSTDGSLALLQEYAKTEPRLKVIALSENVGAHEARVSGIAASQAPWIGFVDADDVPDRNLYLNLYTAGSGQGAPDVVICSAHVINESGVRSGYKVRFTEEAQFEGGNFHRFCSGEFGSGMLWNKLYRRELICRHGSLHFSRRQDSDEDTLVNIGCFYEAKTVKVIPESLYGYRKHSASATQSVDHGKRYARLLAAYLEAIHCYASLGSAALVEIDLLYRSRVSQFHCGVSSPEQLQAHSMWLTELVQEFAVKRPSALYELMNQGLANPVFFEQHGSLPSQWLRMTRKLISRLLKGA